MPEPVVPATSRCGSFAISTVIGFPSVSRPKATSSGLLLFAYGRTSPRHTLCLSWFGISMPTSEVPGIGAKMRTEVAASESAISSSRFVMRLTRSPSPMEIWNVVTIGPETHPVTLAVRPNSSSVLWSFSAVDLSSSCELMDWAESGFDSRRESGGSSPGSAEEAAAVWAGADASFFWICVFLPSARAAASFRKSGTA